MAIEFYPMHTWDKLEEFLVSGSSSGMFFQDIIFTDATQDIPYRRITLVGLKGKKIADLYEYVNSDGIACIAGIRIYKSDEETYQEPFSLGSGTQSRRKLQYVAVCKNGMLIRFGYNGLSADANVDNADYTCEILITLNNNMSTTVIVSSYSGDSSRLTNLSTDISSSSEDDDSNLIINLNYKSVSMEQWQLISFTTVGGSGIISYTPNAFYLQSKTFGFIPYFSRFMDSSGVLYMTNGFWAIKDI